MKYVAYITKGLEEVGKLELERVFPDFKAIEIKDKRIIFVTEVHPEVLQKLTTIDDIGLLVTQIGNGKGVSGIVEEIDAVDFAALRSKISQFRKMNVNFSLTIGVAGTSIDAASLARSLSDKIQEKYGWNFTPLEHENFDIRIFVDHSECIISVRLTQESLHHRTYKTVSKPGSLKPTVAAAMVLLATEFQTGLKIVDNFCGSGTILCEAFLTGNVVYGGDIDSESVQITKKNLANLYHAAKD